MSQINQADTAWVLVCTLVVFFMIPGLGYFYGGIARKHNKLTLLAASALAIGVVAIQWFLFGYSLTFSSTGSHFIGNFQNALLINVGAEPHPLGPTIPGNLYMVFQGMFAAITPCVAFGSAAERTTLTSYLIFLFVWSSLVYDFIAYWTWAERGWLHDFGVLDFAGGTPVHVSSGFSALAYAIAVGPRRTVDFKKLRPSSFADVYLGTSILWFGWFGFNGGCELAINARTVNVVIVSHLSGAVGGLTWMFAEMIKHKKHKLSLNAFCSGAITGLVVITPAAGFVRPHYALIFGFLGALVCLFACDIKKITKFKFDDTCDVFGIHGVGGFLGCILTGIFAENSVATMSGGSPIKGGWLDGNYIQVCYQLMSAVVAAAWSFVITFLILQIIGFIPCMRLKLSEKEEEIGSDWIELGEIDHDDDVEKYELEHFKKMLEESKSKDSNLAILKGYFSRRRNDRVTAGEELDLAQEVVVTDDRKVVTCSNKSAVGAEIRQQINSF